MAAYEPINYTAMMPQVNLVQSLGQGFQLGSAIKAQQAKAAQEQAAQAQMEQYKADLQNSLSNPTAQNWAAMSAKYPQQREAFKQSWDMLDKDQRDQDYLAGAQAFNALQNGNTDVAKSQLDQRITAMENSGQDASRLKSMRSTLDSNPQAVQGQLGLVLSSIDPDRWSKMAKAPTEMEAANLGIAKTRSDISKTESDIEKQRIESQFIVPRAQAELASIQSQIGERSERLSLDRDKLQSEYEFKTYEMEQKRGEVPESAKKIVNEATMAAVTADQSAQQMIGLADRLAADGGGYGKFSGANEWWKNATGNQDVVSDMRKEYTRLRNNAVIQSLPPGVASDRDISTAMEGFPAPTADARSLASFLKGMAKLQQYASASSSAQAEWANSVGSMGKSKRDMEIGGVKVPAGTTFPEFSTQFVQKIADDRGAQQSLQALKGKSYMQYGGAQGSY